jgi:hypothetical protein
VGGRLVAPGRHHGLGRRLPGLWVIAALLAPLLVSGLVAFAMPTVVLGLLDVGLPAPLVIWVVIN